MLELEREIETHPDDPEPYLILADMLQSEGDPRGRLILLQHRTNDHPDDRGAADELTQLWAEHEARLLGSLCHVRSTVEISWALGYVHALRLEAPTIERLVDDLELALGSPSLRFVRSVELTTSERLTPTGKAEGYGRVAAKLIELGPRSTQHVQLGQPGDYALSPALRATFPGLDAARDPREIGAELEAGFAACKRLKVKFDATKLPTLLPATSGVALDLDPQQLLLGLKGELDKGKPIAIVSGMTRLYSADSLDRFAAALVTQFDELGSSSNYAQLWAIEAAGALGGQQTIVAIADLLRGGEWSLERFARGLEILAKIGGSLAIEELYQLSLEDDGERRGDARATLDRCAGASRRSFDTILDELSPSQLDASLRPRLDRHFMRRLADLMLSGHRIAWQNFAANILGQPGRLEQAATMLWGAFEQQDTLVTLFRISSEGAPLGLRGEPLEVARELGVGVIHPAELDEATRRSWREVFERQRLEQAVVQLDRPAFQLTRRELATGQIERFFDQFVDGSAIATALHDRGYYGGVKRFDRQDLRVRIIAPQVDFGLPLEQVHPVIVSEVLTDMELALRPLTRALRCAHCDGRIDEDAPRVGVYFSNPRQGTASAWVHFECHRSWAALESEEALDRELH
jgi:uncharacterized protein (TIGR02996 family)